MGNAIDCPTCRGSGFLVADEPPHAGGHNRYDPHCRERRPNDALKSDEFCTLCPGPSVVTPPAQDEQRPNYCGHESTHAPHLNCCGYQVEFPFSAAPSVSTDIADEKPGQQQAINVALTAFYASPANEHTRHAVRAAVEAAYPVIARAVLQDFLDNYTKGLAGRG